MILRDHESSTATRMAKILVVDDDPVMAHLTKAILIKNGYDVVVLHEARKAIEEAKKQRPDLILMDLVMPQFSGEEAIMELKKDSSLSQIPIIILTALLTPEEYWEMTRFAVNGKVYKTLCKPYEIGELLKVVKESLWWLH